MSDTTGPRRRRTGASGVAVDTARRRPAWLIPLLALLALVLVGVLLWLILRDPDSDSTPVAATGAAGTTGPAATASVTASSDPSGTASATATASASATAAGDGSTATDGQVLAGGQTVLPLAAGTTDLTRFAGRTATARLVAVQSVPADEGFWVGTSVTDRVWVQLTGAAGESAVTVKQGDRISFTDGAVVPTPAGYAAKVGVDAAEGATQLAAQKQHIEIAKNAIKLNQ